MQLNDIDILAGLNPEQLQAVTADEGSTLVLAGAGSGKTRVLAVKVAWVVKQKQLPLHHILAVTFTNKAANEMTHRVASLLKTNISQLWSGTFHSICLKLLIKHYKQAGLARNFQVIDASEQLSLIKKIIKDSGLDENLYTPKELQRFINSQKEQVKRSTAIATNGLKDEYWVRLYQSYEAACLKSSLVDFTELLFGTYELFCNNTDLLELYQKQFKYILIDEFQDTNTLQYNLIKLIGAGSDTKLFAVGDDDQSIYSFRGAKVSNMHNFIADFKVKLPIRLEQNYRSTSNILNAANQVISNNQQRIGKNLWTENHTGEKLGFYEGLTEEEEARFVISQIFKLTKLGYEYCDIAILYRSNAQSRIFEQLCASNNIPYLVYGGVRFFERLEVKYVLSYLRLLVNQDDDVAFNRIINYPPRGIGAKTIQIIQEYALEHDLSLFAAANALSKAQSKLKLKLSPFIQLVISMVKGIERLSLAKSLQYVIECSGIGELYRTNITEYGERLENLNELVNSVANDPANEDKDIFQFLTDLALESSLSVKDQGVKPLQLMTIHAAKGLEFKVAFITGLEDGLFPHANSLQMTHLLEEERRLMYVAMTRAKERLYLLRACSRLLWGSRQMSPLSRFVNEIPVTLIDNLSEYAVLAQQIQVSKLNDGLNQSNVSAKHYPKLSKISLNINGLTYKIGDLVTHAKFGDGKILHINTDDKKNVANIFFIGIGEKSLDLNIAKIAKK